MKKKPIKLGRGKTVSPEAPTNHQHRSKLAVRVSEQSPPADPFPIIPITFPVPKYEQGKTIKPASPAPTYAATEYMRQLEEMEGKRYRYSLLEKHRQLFEVDPKAGTSLQVVRARCMYRLQMLGHRQLGIRPPIKFQQNYNAAMKFDAKPFEGFTRSVAEVGKLLCLTEREVSVMAIKKSKPKPSSKPSTRQMFGELSMTETIRYMAKVLHAGAAQIETALKKLNLEAKKSTIAAQRHRALHGLLPIPKMSAEQVSKLKAVIPAEVIREKSPKKAIKPAPKKLVKKIVKLSKVTA